MKHVNLHLGIQTKTRLTHAAAALCAALLIPAALSVEVGCNGLPSNKENATETPKSLPQTFMAPAVGNGNNPNSVLQIYTVDSAAETFTLATNALSLGSQTQIDQSGQITPLARDLLGLATTYSYPFGRAVGTAAGTTYSPALPGGWAVELSDKTGGLIQLRNQPVTPLVEAVCPSASKPQTYQFITLPNALLMADPTNSQPTAVKMWNPAFETAYGSVAISGSGNAVTLASTQQSTLTGTAPGTAYAASATGVCAPTLYGDTISIPEQLTITNPGNGQQVSAVATIGISASGLLVEDNGSELNAGALYSNGLGYQNALGAGTGAIGMLKPLSPVDTGALVAAQYDGFIFGSGNTTGASNFSSTVASFGFPAAPTPSACPDVPVPNGASGTVIDGGDFPDSANLKNDPSAPAVQSAGGFGNCNYAIDLGTQDTANNGLYPTATVYVGKTFSANKSGNSYSFSAIAIAGQLAGKNAIFLLGVDTIGSPNQAVGIYLLQSN